MNKKRVNEWIPRAKDALVKAGVAEDNKINSTFRGQISSFGAAVTMGSLTAAVAFFSQNGNATTERRNLIRALDYVIHDRTECQDVKAVFESVCRASEKELRYLADAYIDASIALKLAMNFFDMGKKDGEDNGDA